MFECIQMLSRTVIFYIYLQLNVLIGYHFVPQVIWAMFSHEVVIINSITYSRAIYRPISRAIKGSTDYYPYLELPKNVKKSEVRLISDTANNLFRYNCICIHERRMRFAQSYNRQWINRTGIAANTLDVIGSALPPVSSPHWIATSAHNFCLFTSRQLHTMTSREKDNNVPRKRRASHEADTGYKYIGWV